MISTEYKNCLSLMRLWAAIGITYTHAVWLLKIDIPQLIKEILWLPGVPFFCCLTGFLIWPSIGRSKSFGEFCKKRFWRIYPEMWISVVLGSVCMLFFANNIKWIEFILFFINQLFFPNMWSPDFLVFGCPWPYDPLWYIRVLLQFYIIFFFLYKFIKKRKVTQILLLVLSILIAYFHENICSFLPRIMAILYEKSLMQYMWLFLWGIILSENKDFFIRFAKQYWIFFAIIAYVLTKSDYDIILCKFNYGLFSSTLSFVAILGFAYRFPQLNIKTDISYAIYVYHMIVVFCFIQIGCARSLFYLALVFVITIPLSFISTKTIGSYGLKKKQKL